MGGILAQIGVQQIKGNAAHGNFPDHGPDILRRPGNRNEYFMTLFITNFFQGKMVQIRVEILLKLPPVLVDALMKVSLPIKRPTPQGVNSGRKPP